jgi:predicted ATP-grasp superfamily ATP-dependent carboligase
MSEVININGTKYTEEDFNDEQKYLLRQIRSCKAKAAQLTFDLDQVKVAEQAFTQGFLVSVEVENKEKGEALVS